MDVQDDELLESGRPPLPRPARVAVLVLVVAALATMFAVRLWPGSGPKPHPAALGSAPAVTTPTTSPINPTPRPRPATRQWPTARSACGGETDVAIAQTQKPAGPTGLRLLLGGSALRIVDFDRGRVTALPSRALAGRYVSGLIGAGPTYATTVPCGVGPARILRIGADGSVQDLGPLAADQQVIAEGRRAWIATNPRGQHDPRGTVTPVGGGRTVQLPPHVFPTAVVRGKIVGAVEPSSTGAPTGLALLDPNSGAVRRLFRSGDVPIATGYGQVIWTSGCNVERATPCMLHRSRRPPYDPWLVALPRPAFAGAVSPDGRHVALVVERPPRANRYVGHPFPPSEIAMLDLASGGFYRVPHLLIPAKSTPGLTFSADGNWIAIALDAGNRTRLLAWHPGLHRAYEMGSIPGANYGSPPLIALPNRTG